MFVQQGGESNIRNRQFEDRLVLLADLLEVLDQIGNILILSSLLSLLALSELGSVEQTSQTQLVDDTREVVLQSYA